MQRTRFTLLMPILCFLVTSAAHAQQADVWTLERCVQYATDHNLDIRLNVLNERLAKLTLKQSQLSQLPNANVNGAYGRSYGRSVDPTTNQFVDGSYDFLSLGGNADVLVFGWFQKRNTIAANSLLSKAATADVDQLRDDVSLNVATGFLRAILAKEQIRVNEKQVALSSAQLDQTRSFVQAGRLPELNAAQLESQLATDSANLITAIADYNASILDLKALLNLDFAVPFEIQPPNISMEQQLALSDQDPESIYAEAKKHFGAIRGSDLRLQAAERNLRAAKGALYPSLTLGAQLGTNWASTYRDLVGVTEGTPGPSQYFVPFQDTVVSVYQRNFSPIYRNTPFGDQLSNNFRQTFTINLNIPIFNAWQAQYNVRRARIDMQSREINRYQAELTLRQNVYKAYNDARNSVQKYYAAQRAADAASRAYDFAEKRYQLGLTNTIEYLTTQNNQYRADASALSAKYDLIFRLKVIDYYLGKQLKL